MICSLIFSFFSCHENTSKWTKILAVYGDQRHEVEEVLNHYSKSPEDSLKLRAAIFLIKEIPYKFSYQGEGLESFFSFCDSISISEISSVAYNKRLTAYYQKNKSLVGEPTRIYDQEMITSEYLISNIDRAFETFNKCRWKNEVSFDDFCEYILPYKVGNEKPEFFRDTLLRNMHFDSIKNLDLEGAANYILEKISTKGMFLAVYPDAVPDFPLSHLMKIKGGTCSESSSLSIYVMRACGLPVARDFTPQWPHRAKGHLWSSLIINDSTCKEFEGVNAGKVGNHLQLSTDNRIAKIYRRTYSKQQASLAVLHGTEAIPPEFGDPFLKDISSSYFKGVDVTLNFDSLSNLQRRFGYLCIFDNVDWTPICWAPIETGNAKFSDVGKNVVYLPAKFCEGKIIASGYPVLVNSNGQINQIKSETNKKQKLVLTRKYPVLDWWDSRTLAMVGGKFQAANNPDFSDAVNVHIVRDAPEMKYLTFNISEKRAFRYWRYLAADSSYGDIAEINFFNSKKEEMLGSIIGTTGFDPAFDKNAVFDKNPLTYYQGATSGNNWVGIDFGKPQAIEAIRYLCRNDDNFINSTDEYELYFWDTNHWHTLGKKKGNTNQSLIYDNAPVNALFLLRDHTKGKEERIFTYSNGKQVWW